MFLFNRMEWEKNIINKMPHITPADYEDMRRICLNAFAEGCTNEKGLAVEAYRLCCHNLFGNKCLDQTNRNKLCDGNCIYLKRYLSELAKLER